MIPTPSNGSLGCQRSKKAFRVLDPDSSQAVQLHVLIADRLVDGDTSAPEAALDQAITHLELAVDAAPKTLAGTRIDILQQRLADLYMKRERWADAGRVLETALGGRESAFRGHPMHSGRLYEAGRDNAMHAMAAYCAGRQGDARGALAWLEKGRARVIGDLLDLKIERPDGTSDEAWSTYVEATKRLAYVRGDGGFEDAMSVGGSDPLVAMDRLQAGHDEAVGAVQAAREALGLPPIPTRDAVLQLDPNVAVISFCVVEPGAMAIVQMQDAGDPVAMLLPEMTQHALSMVLFGDAEDEHTDAIGFSSISFGDDEQSLTEQMRRELCERTLATLGAMLQPILGALPSTVTRLILIPHGALYLLPLHAAVVATAPRTHLCDRFDVAHVPSLRVLQRRRAPKRTALRDAQAVAIYNSKSDPPLDFARREVETVSWYFPSSTVLDGGTEQKAALLHRLAAATVLHVACHASLDKKNARNLTLQMIDGGWSTSEVWVDADRLEHVELVTLSACASGLVDLTGQTASEFVGIPAGFLLAGARSVLSSLWPIDDLPTALLMDRFYRALLGLDDPVRALREAQRSMPQLTNADVADYVVSIDEASRRRGENTFEAHAAEWKERARVNSGDRPFANPLYWAAFTVTGL